MILRIDVPKDCEPVIHRMAPATVAAMHAELYAEIRLICRLWMAGRWIERAARDGRRLGLIDKR